MDPLYTVAPPTGWSTEAGTLPVTENSLPHNVAYSVDNLMRNALLHRTKTSFLWVPSTDCLELIPLLWNSPLERYIISLKPRKSFLLIPSVFPPGLVFKSLHQQAIVERCPLIILQVWPYDPCPGGDLISAKGSGTPHFSSCRHSHS